VTTRQAARGRRHWALFLGLAATVILLDQPSKAWIVANIAPGEFVELLGSYLRLIYTENDGGLFGLFQGNAALFAAVSSVVVGVIVLFHARSAPSRSTSIALGLLLGGAIGNLLDRVRYGFVVDFVDMGIGDLRFYTYNVADAAITTAIIALIVLAVFPGVGEAIDRRGAPTEPGPGQPAEAGQPAGPGQPAEAEAGQPAEPSPGDEARAGG
jgi:signal peptidase II